MLDEGTMLLDEVSQDTETAEAGRTPCAATVDEAPLDIEDDDRGVRPTASAPLRLNL